MNTETVGREELAEILERNGFHTAAADVLAGVPLAQATAYVSRSERRYDDGEARWLESYVNDLQKGKT